MDWNVAADDWAHFRSEVHSRWRRLSESQLDTIAGRRVSLAEQVRESYGLTEDQVESAICFFEACNESLRGVSSR